VVRHQIIGTTPHRRLIKRFVFPVFELQSSHDNELVETTWFRQAALFRCHPLGVLTVLLRRKVKSPSLTGRFWIRVPDGWLTNQYNYRVVRLWQEGPEPHAIVGVNLVTLAPLTIVTQDARD
jgi:hypothetical protein